MSAAGEGGAKFAKRQGAIIDAASMLLNRDGAHALRLADVAEHLDLDISSLNYYFRKKDALIAACLERSVLWLEDSAKDAGTRPDPMGRADALLAHHFAMFARQREGEGVLALLSDLPSLVDEARKPLETHIDIAMRTIGDFFDATPPHGTRSRQLLSANVLASNFFWLPAWQNNYAQADFDRVRAGLIDLFARGLFTDAPEAGRPDPLEPEVEDEARANFLDAATRLINRHGHKGARVEMVAAELGLSTGSFYHHLRTKNELVSACFERSFAVVEGALDRAAGEPTGAATLVRLTRSIAHYQLSARAPLLRIGSYQALPADLRQQMVLRSLRLTNRIAGVIASGVADGSIRSCDTGLAAQYYLAAIYGFSDLREWSEPTQSTRLVERLIDLLHRGAG